MTITFYGLKYESKHSIQDDLIRFWIDNGDMELIEENNLWEGRTEYDSEGKVIPPPLDWKGREVIEGEKIVDVPNYTEYTDYQGESVRILSRENTQSQIEILTQALKQLQAHVFKK